MNAMRVVVIVVAVMLVGSFYSIHELHNISAAHMAKENGELGSRTGGRKSVSSSAASSSKLAVTAKPSTTQAASTVGSSSTSVAAQASSSSGLGSDSFKEDKNGNTCYVYEHTELWGDVVKWGASNKQDSALACCNACRNHVVENDEGFPCNVWVWNHDKNSPNYQECWLKHLAHPDATKPSKQGPEVPWTAGTVNVDINGASLVPQSEKAVLRKYHTITSAQGASTHWQIRIHYYHYKKMRAQCEMEGKCEMGGFTRLLHSGKPDDLMEEIPTVVADPLPNDEVEHGWYVVLNRPYAFVQWLKAQNIPERYVLMSEPDHIFIKPMPNFMSSDNPAAFPFFYIEPGNPKHSHCTMKFTGKISNRQMDEIAPIGSSPTFLTLEDMTRVMPLWMNTSIAIFKDPESNKAWGWVQEMYGFAIALWLGGVKRVDLYLHMMAQPPWDAEMEMSPGKPFPIIHYTYGMDYKLDGTFTPGKFGEWRFDKRSFGGKPLGRGLKDPPDGMKNDLVRTLINSFNEATKAIPCWDDYAKTGKVTTGCGELPGGFLAEEAAAKASSRRLL